MKKKTQNVILQIGTKSVWDWQKRSN